MKKLIYALLLSIAGAAVVACTDGSSIGNSLSDENTVIVVDTNFSVTGSTVPNPVVQSRTLSQLIGNIDAKGFGSIYSDFVGQFMPSIALDTTDITADQIDSVKLFVQMLRGNFVGDSLAPMGLTVYRLNKDLPYPIFSDFDPEGYYDPNDILCEGIYTASSMNEPDSVKKLNIIYKAMHMPVSLGVEILEAYKSNPGAFYNPETFAKDVFKGVYIRSSYGSGRISDFSTTSIRYYFHKEEYNADSARYETNYYVGDYFAVTPEVVVNNNIRYTVAPELEAMVKAGENIMAAPAGFEIEMRFPAPELLASYNKYSDKLRVLNTLTFSLPAENITNDYGITPPPYILMVLKKDKEEFFANNSLADNVTSFYAPYDATSGSYKFNSMRSYLLQLIEKEAVTEDDYTFILSPVQVNMEASASSGYYTSSGAVESSIVPYVSKPAMCRFLLDKAKITLTFSANNGKNL